MRTSKQEAYRVNLIKRLHAVKTEIGLTDDQYRAALSGFGVESSKELSIDELIRVIGLLQSINPDDDKWRKRCMAAIAAYLRATNRNCNVEIIKGIACRASGYASFNKIPVSRLRDIYYEFVRKAKVNARVNRIVEIDVDELSLLN